MSSDLTIFSKPTNTETIFPKLTGHNPHEQTQSIRTLSQDLFAQYQELAGEGNPIILFGLGLMCMQGNGTDKSDSAAFVYFKTAADNGYPKAQIEVARRYKLGIGTKIDLKESLKYLEMAESKELTGACGILKKIGAHRGLELINEIVPPNETLPPKIISFTKPIDKADRKIMIFNDNKEIADLDPENPLYQDFDIPLVQYDVGYMYEKGYGTTKSLEEAFSYYKKSADLGCREAQHKVANMYWKGAGVRQSYRDAHTYYDLATRSRNDEIRRDFDSMMNEYFSLKEDNHLNYSLLITQHDNPQALRDLARMHREVAGRNQIPSEAFRLLHIAADEFADKEAQFELGNMYATSGLQANQRSAFIYYEKAVNGGHKRAVLVLKMFQEQQ